MGIPMALILISWFFKYAYILFDYTVRGFDEPPVLDIQMVNPLNEQRPLAQLVILGLIYVAVEFVHRAMGAAAAGVLAGIAGLFLPASVAVLGLEGNLFKAAYPVAWVRIAVGLGPMYILVLAIMAGYALLIGLLAGWELPLTVQIATMMFCFLSAFSVLGGALYERRHELGLETYVSPERTEERRLVEDWRQSDREVAEAYGQMRAGSHTLAWEQLQNWLRSRSNTPEDYKCLCARVVKWGDPRYITRLTEDYVDRLLTLKRNGEALDLVTARLVDDPNFRPKSAAATLQIARLGAAAGGGGKRVARTLLADFSKRFAGDPSIPAATSLTQQLDS
jgi:hypothetical protein